MRRLRMQIELLRNRMVEVAEQKGIQDEEVLKVSQQLDVLILRYELLLREKKRSMWAEAI